MVMGKVTVMSGRGVRIALTNGSVGSVALTDLHDKFVPNALEGLVGCPYVRACILPAGPSDKPGSLRLSLKQSDGAAHAGMLPITCTSHSRRTTQVGSKRMQFYHN